MTDVSLEVKAEFLDNVFSAWEDGEYRDEPLNTHIWNANALRAVVLLWSTELLDLYAMSDYEWLINRGYDFFFPLIQEAVQK